MLIRIVKDNVRHLSIDRNGYIHIFHYWPVYEDGDLLDNLERSKFVCYYRKDVHWDESHEWVTRDR
jgi:hypothetical protein